MDGKSFEIGPAESFRDSCAVCYLHIIIVTIPGIGILVFDLEGLFDNIEANNVAKLDSPDTIEIIQVREAIRIEAGGSDRLKIGDVSSTCC